MSEQTMTGLPVSRKTSLRGATEALVRVFAVILAFSAEGIHLAMLQDHQRVWWGYGLFFLGVAMAQGILGVSLLFNRPGRLVALAGIAGNALVVLIWLVTRLGGIPGLFTFQRLPLSVESGAATLLELGLIAILVGVSGAATAGVTALTRPTATPPPPPPKGHPGTRVPGPLSQERVRKGRRAPLSRRNGRGAGR